MISNKGGYQPPLLFWYIPCLNTLILYNIYMIDRYSREEIKKIWDLKEKFTYYLKVELAVCEAYSRLERIPKNRLEEIKNSASFSIDRIE